LDTQRIVQPLEVCVRTRAAELSPKLKLGYIPVRDAGLRRSVPNQVDAANLVRPDDLLFIDEKDAQAGDVEQFVYLRHRRLVVAPGVPIVACLTDPMCLIRDKNVESVLRRLGEAVEEFE